MVPLGHSLTVPNSIMQSNRTFLSAERPIGGARCAISEGSLTKAHKKVEILLDSTKGTCRLKVESASEGHMREARWREKRWYRTCCGCMRALGPSSDPATEPV